MAQTVGARAPTALGSVSAREHAFPECQAPNFVERSHTAVADHATISLTPNCDVCGEWIMVVPLRGVTHKEKF